MRNGSTLETPTRHLTPNWWKDSSMPNPNPKLLPSVDYLRACFDYDPDSGVIRWRKRPREHFNSELAYRVFRGRNAGREITHIDPKGYCNLTLDGMHYRAARVIWKWMTGNEPPAIVDHADRDKLNNRWANLRAATPAQSIHNQTPRPNATGYRGVIKGKLKSRTKWYAHINHNGRTRSLGTFKSAEEASAAYEECLRRLHGEFYSGAIFSQE
jgi:hypothetical protein